MKRVSYSFTCQGLLQAKKVNGDLTKLGYDKFNVLNAIITPEGDTLGFDFDILGRLRKYDTSTRESTFNFEGSKRLGEFDNSADEWKRHHWCKTQLLGYADDTNTYYIVPDVTGSTKLIMNINSVVNRLDYDHLGYLRNKTTDPQVELLWRKRFLNKDLNIYLFNKGKMYDPLMGMFYFPQKPNRSLRDLDGWGESENCAKYMNRWIDAQYLAEKYQKISDCFGHWDALCTEATGMTELEACDEFGDGDCLEAQEEVERLQGNAEGRAFRNRILWNACTSSRIIAWILRHPPGGWL